MYLGCRKPRRISRVKLARCPIHTPWVAYRRITDFDCCVATLAARYCGTGANWFLGASAKESVATGVSRDSFNSTLIREIDRWAHQYWTRNMTFTVQSIHHALTVWDSDLAHTPNLVRLTDHEYYPTELTPLLYPRGRTQLPKTGTEPVD